MARVYLLSLGCPKNLVDSEALLKKLGDKGMTYSSSPADAEVLIVNTCGFIEEARRESIEEILRLAGSKKGDRKKKVLVYGCLAQRSGAELRKEIPEIDGLWGVGAEDEIVRYCEKVGSAPVIRKDAAGKNERINDKPYAYLKIAEGCDRGCSYCVIPDIRGGFRSRRPEEILGEAEALVRSGIKELVVIAQDITSFGKELGDYDLAKLVREIAGIRGDFWVRLLYLYPTSVNDRLIETIANEEKVCKYIDMPLQHSEEKILRLMHRAGGRVFFEKLIRKIRGAVPGVNIRTTFIVGFPQETDEDFEGLLSFVKRIKFERLGAFTYSKEAGTPAAGLKGQVRKQTKKQRYERLMEMQAPISLAKNRELVGKTLKALVDEVDEGVAIARLSTQAPEIDGVVFIEDEGIGKGSFVNVKITDAYDYDLKGTAVK